MSHLSNIKKNYFYIFLFIYCFFGIFLSLNVGITHDEYHDFFVGEANKKKILSFFFNENNNLDLLSGLNRYYGSGFHFISAPVELIINSLFDINYVSLNTKPILLKHPSVFIFFIISSIYFKKIITIVVGNKNYSSICTILYLLFPYLLGHSFFNIKDIPFLSVWLVCTYFVINFVNSHIQKKKIKNKNILIFGLVTAYLFSIRISGILILLEYLIFLTFMINITKSKYSNFLKIYYKQIAFFLFITVAFFYLLSPSYWSNPLDVIKGIKAMSNHIQTVCTVTLGECMKAQNLPSTYLPIWFFFKLPVIILYGLLYLIFKEKSFFSNLKNKIFIGPLLVSTLVILLLLIILNVNLYDEIRQVMFLIPLFFIISLVAIYNLSNKIKYTFLALTILFFTFQNIKIYPYNYVWLNTLTMLTKVSDNFELDYWGVSTKEISNYFTEVENISDECIISNRNRGIKDFIIEKDICFKSFNELHGKNKRPFFVVLTERALNKGLPNNCKNIYNEKIKLNFVENLTLAKVYKCD